MLGALDDAPTEDSVGREIGTFRGNDFRTADSLVRRGLARFDVGRFLDCYYRLTEAGRAAIR
jgi:hypothetical protein